MKEKLTTEEYTSIEQLVEYALDAPNKKEAQKYINKIQSYGYSLFGNANYILGELVCYVKDASGRVTDKEYAKQYLAKLEKYQLEQSEYGRNHNAVLTERRMIERVKAGLK